MSIHVNTNTYSLIPAVPQDGLTLPRPAIWPWDSSWCRLLSFVPSFWPSLTPTLACAGPCCSSHHHHVGLSLLPLPPSWRLFPTCCGIVTALSRSPKKTAPFFFFFFLAFPKMWPCSLMFFWAPLLRNLYRLPIAE